MKLEVGKSYRTQNGEKVTIVSKDDCEDYYPFNGSNGETYQEDGRTLCGYEDGGDLVVLCVDEPAAPKYKAGDILTVRLLAEGAKVMNRPNTNDDVLEIISHTPAPEPEFDWSTVKAGMAFERQGNIFWYVSADITDEYFAVFSNSKEWHSFGSCLKGDFKRTPEHDMEVK